jgi:hypothetical protein
MARSLFALRGWFAIAFVAVWNALLGAAWALNGGGHRLVVPVSRALFVATMFATMTLALGITLSGRLRARVIHPDRRAAYGPGMFLLIASVCGLLGAVEALSAK